MNNIRIRIRSFWKKQILFVFVFGQNSDAEYYSYSYLVKKTVFAHLWFALLLTHITSQKHFKGRSSLFIIQMFVKLISVDESLLILSNFHSMISFLLGAPWWSNKVTASSLFNCASEFWALRRGQIDADDAILLRAVPFLIGQSPGLLSHCLSTTLSISIDRTIFSNLSIACWVKLAKLLRPICKAAPSRTRVELCLSWFLSHPDHHWLLWAISQELRCWG